MGKIEGKRPLGRPRRRREDNIKMGFTELSNQVMKDFLSEAIWPSGLFFFCCKIATRSSSTASGITTPHYVQAGCDPRDWIALADDRDQWRAYVRAVMNLQVP